MNAMMSCRGNEYRGRVAAAMMWSQAAGTFEERASSSGWRGQASEGRGERSLSPQRRGGQLTQKN